MKDSSKNKRLVIRLTPEQQADLKNALGIEKPCEFLEISLAKSTDRSIDSEYGGEVYALYAMPGTPGMADFGDTTIKITD